MTDHTTDEAAVILGVTPSAVRLYISRRQLAATKRSGVNFITAKELTRFQAHRRKPGQPKKVQS